MASCLRGIGILANSTGASCFFGAWPFKFRIVDSPQPNFISKLCHPQDCRLTSLVLFNIQVLQLRHSHHSLWRQSQVLMVRSSWLPLQQLLVSSPHALSWPHSCLLSISPATVQVTPRVYVYLFSAGTCKKLSRVATQIYLETCEIPSQYFSWCGHPWKAECAFSPNKVRMCSSLFPTLRLPHTPRHRAFAVVLKTTPDRSPTAVCVYVCGRWGRH